MRVKTTAYLAICLGLLTSMIFLMGVASGANQVENITWSARLFPDNPEYVEVYVDARSVASNRVVSTASFDVTFYDSSNRPIKKQVINFLDQKLRNFRAGAYHRFFRHSNVAAKRVEGGTFRVFGAAIGGDGKADSSVPLLAQGRPSEWNSAPEQGRLIDNWPAAVAPPAPPLELDPSKAYFIISVSSGKVMDVQNRSLDDWTPVIQTTAEKGASQQWRFEPLHGADEGYYHIRSSRSDKCLDVKLAEQADAAAIIQYGCADGDGQKWRIVPKGEGVQLQAKHSGKVVDVNGAVMEDVPLIQYGAHDGKNQQWKIRETP
jgi:hypothetical protein